MEDRVPAGVDVLLLSLLGFGDGVLDFLVSV